MHRLYANTACRSISDYARKLLLKEPVTQLFRNPALETFCRETPGLMEYISAVASGATPANPEFIDTFGNVVELVEDIRVLLKKLCPSCDQK